ncbi:MAG: hypothetical protein A2431_04125 [Candidatus Zambryskibacteria bacterium RIFOXYC1_FULL_39_10]|uniref:Glycosyl transferase family 1 domain-containing protein n=1 Tax=Candidatus Zambryskibacteria bacterium RIFOXYC1_FULL_39_10 TaxID=1802779 RepID=A0A1G2UZ12_9BACT|nr:MAG: hypothetical protein A2431_04125 [Candidatus Zambryskibacteria bacterium RIFOXYC1_FULL_39_10]OHB16669.1 MAG: hypothetical protein A2605_00735 [Candidatus Zambryskibacteria bacterium RIFOXYD1_FULL_39_35]
MRKHIIIATYDGIGTHYSGVGTIAKNLVFALTKLSDKYDLRVSIAYINVNKQSKVFNEQCFEDSSNLVNKTGGALVPLCNSSKGESEWDMWRSFEEWDFANVSLVTSLNLLLNNDEENILILNDTPFLMFAKFRELLNVKNIKLFYFPLSTGINHNFGPDRWRNKRIKLEKDCFDLISSDTNSKVIALGKCFANRMHQDYDLNFTENDYLQNGLCFEKYQDYLNIKVDNNELEKFSIKIEPDKKIIFAWGRCSIAKGFRELAMAWSKIYSQLPNHYLIIQMPNNSGEMDYFLHIKDILSNIPQSIVLDDFNPDIWKTILRTKNTDVVCIPSLMDPFPHTSIEAKLFSKDTNYITLISNTDGAIDAFGDDEAIYADPRDIDHFSSKIIETVNMNEVQRKNMATKNATTISKFDFVNIFENFLINNL